MIRSLKLKKHRQFNEMFVVEGRKSIHEFIDNGFHLIKLFSVNEKYFKEKAIKILKSDLKKISLAELPEKINLNTWADWTKKILEKCDIKPKELYTKLRIILTGKQFGPSMNNLLTLLNVKEIVNRIKVNSE